MWPVEGKPRFTPEIFRLHSSILRLFLVLPFGGSLKDRKKKLKLFSSISIKKKSTQAWWLMAVIPAFEKLRQGDCKFEASLGNLVRLCLKK